MADQLLSFPLRVRFTGKHADQHRVEAHAGSTSLLGLSRAIQIATKAYLNQTAVSRATALHDADIFLIRVNPGSLNFDFRIEVLRKAAGVTLNVDTFFDFISTVLSRAVGSNYEPKTPYVQRLDQNEEDDLLDQTVEEVEDALRQGHRAIGRSVEGISIIRPRSGQGVFFDAETKEYIEKNVFADEVEALEGHVTRFNSITGNGRAYIGALGRIVPFKLSESYPDEKRGAITWSLHGSNVHRAKNLIFDARTVSSSSGVVKRLVVDNAVQAGNDRN